MEKVKYGYFVVVKKSTYLSFLYFCASKNNETNKYKYVSLSKKVFFGLCPKHY